VALGLAWGGSTLAVTPGTVLSHAKISDTAGGFDGVLDDYDDFGISVASLGDLNGDGVRDLAVGAHWDDDGGDRRGAVWVLFLDAGGTVVSHQKISDLEGDFDGTLDNLDRFGRSVTSLGDLDDDGVGDLAVGAIGDGDGGSNRGAVWVLFLNADGTVKGHQKISDTQGGFAGTLSNEDGFGTSGTSLGDFDGDGVGDFAVGASGDDDGGSGRGAVWVLLLDTDGTVKGHQKVSDMEGGFTGTLDNGDEFGVSVASLNDLDGDGVGDLAVGAIADDDGGGNRGAVWVLFLNPDGTVRSHQKISDTAGGFTGTLDNGDGFGRSVASLGDLDGDGVSDLAVGAWRDDDDVVDGGAVWVLFLNADGTVKAHRKISDTEGGFDGTLRAEDRFGSSLGILGDQDGDLVIDLAVGAFYDNDGGSDHGAVWLLFLDGAPRIDFDPPTEFAAAGAANREATGDLDGDQFADMVIAIPGDPQANGDIQVFLNQGNDQDEQWLGLVADLPDPAGSQPSGVAVASLNLNFDGFLDVAVTNAGDDTVSVLFNAGDGSFPTSSTIAVGNQPSAVGSADFFGDGRADLVVANAGDDTVWILNGDGTGTFVPTDTIFTLGDLPVAVVPSDLDEDKDPDVAGLNSLYAGGPAGSVFVVLNQDGVFDPAVNYAVGNNPSDLSVGDLDRDGQADIVAVNFDDDTASILINQGDGTFADAMELPVGDEPLSVEAVDLDDDGDADLAVVATDSELGPSVQVFRNLSQLPSELLFDAPVAFGVEADPNYVVSDDFNNDELNDLVTVNSVVTMREAGSVAVLLNSPPTPACPWDVDDNGEVTSVTDFLQLLEEWGTDPGGPPDFDNDGTVGVTDFLILLGHWGPCP
jgi:hypothetical protein